jgi:lysophospholipase L1-like esterase
MGLTGRKIGGPNPISSWGLVDAYCAYRGRPGQYSKGKTVNHHGFISTPEIPIQKSEGTIRIVFLGGSSTAGTGRNLADEETWPWKVWEILNKGCSRKIEFINGALGGYTSFESYGRLWSRIRFFSPDVIVVYHGWNEMYYFNSTDVENIVSRNTLRDGSWTLDRTEEPIEVYAPLWIDHLIWGSQALTRLRIRLSGTPHGEIGLLERKKKLLSTEYDSGGLHIWRTNLCLIREASHLLDAQLFVAKQATLIVEDLPVEERKRCGYWRHGFDHYAHVEAFEEIYKIIDEEIPREKIIDVTRISGQPKFFFDHVHPNPAGTHAIAEIIADTLLQQICD